MTRRRITIEGDWYEGALDWSLYDEYGVTVANVDKDALTSIEVIPDPLPTEPGVTFSARYKDDEPAKWFSYRDDHNGDGDICYVSVRGFVAFGSLVQHLVRVAVES